MLFVTTYNVVPNEDHEPDAMFLIHLFPSHNMFLDPQRIRNHLLWVYLPFPFGLSTCVRPFTILDVESCIHSLPLQRFRMPYIFVRASIRLYAMILRVNGPDFPTYVHTIL